jgi:transposase
MPTQSPYRIEFAEEQRAILDERARPHTAPYWEVVRARIVLLASEGTSNKEIAKRLYSTPQTVCKWRKRFYEDGLSGLEDRPRSGRAPVFSPEVRMEVKALACELPATSGLPLSRWSCGEVAQEAIDRGLVAEISGTTVWRWLSEDAIRPFYHRSWIFPRDPDFAHKAGRVLDLYEGRWEGEALGAQEYVISADEKTSIQARDRHHPTQPAGEERPVRVEHDYERRGALAYLAAWDVHRARLFGRCEPKNGRLGPSALWSRM